MPEETKPPYVPVPVWDARKIAEQYGKSIVIILAWDAVHGLLHTTTYGADPQNKAWAAQGGEIASKALGGILDQSVQFEDYRLQQARKLLTALKRFHNPEGCGDHCSNACPQCQATKAIADAEQFL